MFLNPLFVRGFLRLFLVLFCIFNPFLLDLLFFNFIHNLFLFSNNIHHLDIYIFLLFLVKVSRDNNFQFDLCYPDMNLNLL